MTRHWLRANVTKADMRGPDLAPHRAALDSLLRAHLPYPGMVLDRHWTVVLANPACDRLYGGDVVGANIIRRFLSDPAARQAVVNSAEAAWAGLDRLRHQLDRAPFDEHLADLVRLADTALHGVAARASPRRSRCCARGSASAGR